MKRKRTKRRESSTLAKENLMSKTRLIRKRKRWLLVTLRTKKCKKEKMILTRKKTNLNVRMKLVTKVVKRTRMMMSKRVMKKMRMTLTKFLLTETK